MTILIRRVLLISALFVVALALPAVAAEEEPPAEGTRVVDIVFPVDGEYYGEFDNFGDCRSGCSRYHKGADIMADKLTPVVAVADGHVTVVRGIHPVTGEPIQEEGEDHQWLVIQHDGWQTRYLHLNNDTEGTDDGLGFGVAADIIAAFVAAGGSDYDDDFSYPVSAGQLIGWVGDSGNAEESGPHLHFELRIGEGWDAVAIDPHPALTSLQVEVTMPDADYFTDDDGSVHEADINTLAADGTTRGCNPPANDLYCPGRLISRGEIAAFIRRTLDLPPTAEDYFSDDDGSVFNDDINALMSAGIGLECADGAYCPDQPLLRDEMAEMLVLAFAADDPERYDNPDATDYFIDDDGNRFEDSINLLMAAGVTKGCNPPDNDQFCPQRPLNRAELASFFVRALGH